MIGRIAFVCVAAVIAVAAQQNVAPAAGDAASGKVLFTKIGCYECHGYAGQGGAAGARIVPMPLNEQGMIRYVRRPSGEMPAYTGKSASDRELADIYAYLKSFPPAKKAKDIPLLDGIKNRH